MVEDFTWTFLCGAVAGGDSWREGRKVAEYKDKFRLGQLSVSFSPGLGGKVAEFKERFRLGQL